MADALVLTAEARERAGKGAARAARREGRLPAVIYGDKKPPLPISLDYKNAWMAIQKGGFFTSVTTIDIGGQKQKVLARDIQFHPVRDWPIHVDFLRVGAATEVAVNVPVSAVNEDRCPGLVEGGVLNMVRYEVELYCKAEEIPDQVEMDLTGYQVGDSIHISQITLPDGVRPTIDDRDFTVATIAAPSKAPSEEDLEAQEGEGMEAEGGGDGEGGGSGGE